MPEASLVTPLVWNSLVFQLVSLLVKSAGDADTTPDSALLYDGRPLLFDGNFLTYL